MNRVQRVLGYLGAVMLVAGVTITAVGPAELGIVDGGTDDAATTATATAAATSAPESGTASVGTAAGVSQDTRRNATDAGESDADGGSSDGSGGPSLSAVAERRADKRAIRPGASR